MNGAASMDVRGIVERLMANDSAIVSFTDSAGKRTLITHPQLAGLVERKRDQLRAWGVPRRQRIGLLAANSIDFLAWDLAALVDQHIPLVFSENHRGADPGKLAREHHCSIIVTDMVQKSEGHVVRIGEELAQNVRPMTDHVLQDDDDTLTLVFSSGTSGRMKGLRISSKGTRHILQQFVEAFHVTSADRYYSFLPFSYFQQRALYFASLLLGVDTSVVAIERFLAGFGTERPTYTINPPVFYESIHRYVESVRASGNPITLPEVLGGSIRWMITAMAPIRRDVLDYYWRCGVKLLETYGVTETGMVAWNTLGNFKVGTVGRPADDGELTLSDSGEVFIKRRAPLCLGYFVVDHESEAEVFLSDGRVATGDVAELDSDGFLRLIGRTKDAIVCADGRKFHPEVIENLAARCWPEALPILVGGAGLCENTLVLSPRTPGELRLDPEGVITSVRGINERLAPYMRVRSVHISDQLFTPESGFRTRNFKVDRSRICKALIAHEFTGRTIAIGA